MLCVNSLVAIGYVVIMVSLKTLKIVRNPIFRYLTYMAAILKKSNSSHTFNSELACNLFITY